MKNIVILGFVFSLLLINAHAQSVERVDVKKLKLENTFTKIYAEGLFDIYFQSKLADSVEVEAPQTWLQHIVCIVRNDTLFLNLDYQHDFNWKGQKGSSSRIKISLPGNPKLMNVSLLNDAHLFLPQVSQFDTIRLNAKNGSNIKGYISCKHLYLSLMAGSKADLIGKADMMTLNINGGSVLSGLRLQTAESSIKAYGSSKVYLNVTDQYVADISNDVILKIIGSAIKKPKLNK